ncbi:Aste57867_13738 [Aphanomyces stellatus]|uniref:Aste57867_13738 protein n=1 Tax=Aphanomyces stellatus TaxID=120398 RepID=A0A485KZG1_9STRA|nr:hypothetical protein As57867_013688 [Aphanomyces stellatus]VFT90571.1 Aste57867_13738 [Aphanomyces stellatus]
MKLVQHAAEDQLSMVPPPKVDSHVVPFVSAFLPWLYLAHHADAKFIDRVLALLAKSDGRDKACKIVQYFCKLAMAVHEPKYKPLVGVLAKQLSGTRRVLRIGKCLKVVGNTVDAWGEPVAWKRAAGLLGAGVSCAGDFGDDVCWASDMQLLPVWVSDCEVWIDRLWLVSIVCDVPLHMADLLAARQALLACDADTDETEVRRRRAKFFNLAVGQVKLIADFFHASRKAMNWPTRSPVQDAVCGLVSASCAFVKLWGATAK